MGVKTDARFTHAGVRLCAALIVSICAATVLTLPTPTAPSELPSLVVNTQVDNAMLTRMRARARHAPTSPAAHTLVAIIDEAGRRERRSMRQPITVEDEEHDVIIARDAVVTAHGQQGLGALRAKAVTRFVDSFVASRTPNDEDHAVVGGFRRALSEWGALRGTRVVAAPLVVRALYAARWNVICRLPPTSGFTRPELRAYHGWFALHAEQAPLEPRVSATTRFGTDGDAQDRLLASEALATLLYRGHQYENAALAFERAADARHSPRLRNYARAARSLVE